MISVILIWIYMIITCYLIGYAALWLLAEKQGYSIKNSSSYLYAGIVAITVYAQFFSIFYKVGLLANVVLLIICGIIALRFRQELCGRLSIMRESITPIKAIMFILMFLLFAYGTSTGIIHYDTGLYHAQSIRWIEEYGVVPGLVNLHNRLAYNSASFCLSAMYSFAFLGGRSFHCCAGFMAFLLAITCMERCSKSRLKNPCLSDFVRILGLYYLLIIFDEMISPASDYFMVLSVFYIIIRWLDLLENNEKSYIPYALLSLMGVAVVTIKLSGAMILLLTLKPLCQMIKEKRGKQIALFISMGIIVAVPFFVRNVILSGWLVYPLTFIDVFNFDFKIPKELALYDAREIQVWGRGYYDVAEFNMPITKWLPGWITSLSMVNKLFLLMAFLGIFAFIIYCVYAVIKVRKDMVDTLLVMGTVGGGLIFFILSSPLIRYGCVFLWVFPALVWGYLYLKISPNLDKYKIFMLGLILIGVYKTGAFAIETYKAATTQYLLVQKDYEDFETLPYEIDGYTFYYSEKGDRTGYKAFPSAPHKMDLILRGDTLKDGFRRKN